MATEAWLCSARAREDADAVGSECADGLWGDAVAERLGECCTGTSCEENVSSRMKRDAFL